MLVETGTDCTGSCKSNYYTITSKTPGTKMYIYAVQLLVLTIKKKGGGLFLIHISTVQSQIRSAYKSPLQ